MFLYLKKRFLQFNIALVYFNLLTKNNLPIVLAGTSVGTTNNSNLIFFHLQISLDEIRECEEENISRRE